MKFWLVFFILISSSLSFSQNIVWGVQSSFLLSSQISKDNDVNYSKDYSLKPGFEVGALAEYQLSRTSIFQSGLLFNTKGFLLKKDLLNENQKISLTTYNFEIPLQIKFIFNKKPLDYFVSGGFYFAYNFLAVLNTQISGTTNFDKDESEKLNIGRDASDDLRATDLGFIANFGINWENILFSINTRYGLKNLQPISSNDFKTNNYSLGFSIGYLWAD